MDQAVIDDLKQFITSTVSQQLTEQLGTFRIEINQRFDKVDSNLSELRTEMYDGFAGVAAIIEAHNEQLDDHEHRLGRLEGQGA